MEEVPRVLIVEDNVELAEMMCELLADAGGSAIHRNTVADAIDALASHAGSIAVLLTDINMSSPMSGIELAVYVSQEWPDVAICVSSGDVDQRPRRLPDKALFLPKPWRSEELIGLVRSVGGFADPESLERL